MSQWTRICAVGALAAAVLSGVGRPASAQLISFYEPPPIYRPVPVPRSVYWPSHTPPYAWPPYALVFPDIDEDDLLPEPDPPQLVPRDDRRDYREDYQDDSVSGQSAELPPHLRRQVVPYQTREAPGTIIIDTPNTYLYYVLGGGKAIRYGIGVGREGFTWSGVRTIDRKMEWPDWEPPAEMIARQPYLPRWVAGGPGNPLGARAMYLKGTLYRIHGTNEPSSIGKRMSSGCIRMLNEDAIDLYNRVHIGTKVVVLPDTRRRPPAEAEAAQEAPDLPLRRSDAAARFSRVPFRSPASSLY
ncbi:MAG TPA: L,D-transpeptidase [Xanthobacteraceae bacterium]|nr:L,D-transpeptidase [Xanthobacteraceae bacterium]